LANRSVSSRRATRRHGNRWGLRPRPPCSGGYS
jgi:hypothetical protein